MIYQQTIKKSVKLTGIGLHSGANVKMTIQPAAINSGIRFVRTDINPVALFPANSSQIKDTRFATTIGTKTGVVSTVEHLMAAFFSSGIDNAIVQIEGPEVPAMDGSAYPFIKALKDTGLAKQEAEKKYINILKKIEIRSDDKYIAVEPWSSFAVEVEVDFKHPVISRQKVAMELSPCLFEKHISKARTFGFLKEVELLKKNGLARGGSLDNAVVVGDDGVLNPDGLRYSDEFARHKALDLIGDMYLLGCPIIGKLTAYKSGHTLHQALMEALKRDTSAWELTSFSSEHEHFLSSACL